MILKKTLNLSFIKITTIHTKSKSTTRLSVILKQIPTFRQKVFSYWHYPPDRLESKTFVLCDQLDEVTVVTGAIVADVKQLRYVYNNTKKRKYVIRRVSFYYSYKYNQPQQIHTIVQWIQYWISELSKSW